HALTRTANRIALLVKQTANLADQQHVLPLIVTAVATPLHGLQLRKLLLPVTQHVRLDRTELADLANGEVAFARNGRQFVVMTWFQHTLRPLLSVSAQAGTSRRVAQKLEFLPRFWDSDRAADFYRANRSSRSPTVSLVRYFPG